MKDYYGQSAVRRAIIDFVYSGSPHPSREGAFFNEEIGEIQRHSPGEDGDSVLVIDSEESFARALRAGATAFYASYWRYSDPSKASGMRGRDLTWSVKAVDGGLPAAREMTTQFLDALEAEGFPDPLVKYSGKLGFDVMIPLEELQAGCLDDLNFLSKVQGDLTSRASKYIGARDSFDSEGGQSQPKFKVKFKGSLGTCYLTELRWSRGLILAPMSLHPSSGLVSAPLLPDEVPEFSVGDASPERVHPREWSIARVPSENRTQAVFKLTPEGAPLAV